MTVVQLTTTVCELLPTPRVKQAGVSVWTGMQPHAEAKNVARDKWVTLAFATLTVLLSSMAVSVGRASASV